MRLFLKCRIHIQINLLQKKYEFCVQSKVWFTIFSQAKNLQQQMLCEVQIISR